jgi:hypothetical protein
MTGHAYTNGKAILKARTKKLPKQMRKAIRFFYANDFRGNNPAYKGEKDDDDLDSLGYMNELGNMEEKDFVSIYRDLGVVGRLFMGKTLKNLRYDDEFREKSIKKYEKIKKEIDSVDDLDSIGIMELLQIVQNKPARKKKVVRA